MKLFYRILVIIFMVLITTTTFAYFIWYKPKFRIPPHQAYLFKHSANITAFARLKTMADSLKQFASAHGYNDRLCFLADMSLPSGKSRFFVYDMVKDSVLLAGLVAHGSCDKGFQWNPFFSNKLNCGCSSLGKYKIGYSYEGKFGRSYKLYGLEASNSNAFERTVVLHSYGCVPEQETDPLPICNSRGCPMVSPGFFHLLSSYIDHSGRNILLWVFE